MSLQVFKIKEYREEHLDSVFVLYVSQQWANEQNIEPYEVLTVRSNVENTQTPLTVISSTLLKSSQCVLNSLVAEILGVKEGSKIQVERQTLTPIDCVTIERIESKVKEEATTENILPREVIEFFSRKLRFSGLKNLVTLYYKKRPYRLRISSPGIGVKYGLISANTRFRVTRDFLAKIERVIGLDETVERIREVLMWPAIFPQHFKTLNLEQPKGILLVGVPGVGKTHLVKELAKSTGYEFFYIRGPQFISKYYGASEKNLRALFENAAKSAPAIIFFDEIDSIASKRTDAGEPQRRLVSQLLTCMEQTSGKNVIVFGATNHIESLDPALRRPGRFDMEFTLKPPDLSARAQMLKMFSDQNLKDQDAQYLARKTEGFVGADLNMLSKQAKLNVIRRYIAADAEPDVTKVELTLADFEVGLKTVKPSLLRGYNTKTNVKLQDIKGYQPLKRRILTEITHPVIYSSFYERSSVKRLRGILFHGAPGTGKTSLAQAIASQLGYNFIGLSASQLGNKYVGETEANIRDLFSKARYAAPCIVFLDQFEAISRDRSGDSTLVSNYQTGVVGQLLSEMDGLTSGQQVIVIGATNEPKLIDKAFLRPNRFDLILEVPLPNIQECQQIFVFYLQKVLRGPTLTSAVIKSYAVKFKDYEFSGADIQSIVRSAMSHSISRSPPGVLAQRHHKKLPLQLQVSDVEKSFQQHLSQRKIKQLIKNTSALV